MVERLAWMSSLPRSFFRVLSSSEVDISSLLLLSELLPRVLPRGWPVSRRIADGLDRDSLSSVCLWCLSSDSLAAPSPRAPRPFPIAPLRLFLRRPLADRLETEPLRDLERSRDLDRLRRFKNAFVAATANPPFARSSRWLPLPRRCLERERERERVGDRDLWGPLRTR